MCEMHYFIEYRIFSQVQIAYKYQFHINIDQLIMYLVLCYWNTEYMTIFMLI